MVLHKRESENYIPVDGLGERANVPAHRVGSTRHAPLRRAFLNLMQEQRDHYDMKTGFKKGSHGEAVIPESQRELFGEVPQGQLSNLCGGFGDEIWRRFAERDYNSDEFEAICTTCPGELSICSMKSKRFCDRRQGQSAMSESTQPVVKPDIAFIEDLLNGLSAGTICIPRMQRPFVWKPEAIRALFESIQRGYPIGSLLLWDTEAEVSVLDRIGPFKAPPRASGKVSYVLDGHQRLSTLWGVLRLPRDYSRGPKQSDWRWWLYYDPENDEFVHCPRSEPEAYFVSMAGVMKTMDLLRYGRTVTEKFAADAEVYVRQAEKLAESILKFRVSVTRIIGGTLDDAVEIFSRLNTKGTQLTPDQMVAAQTYRKVNSISPNDRRDPGVSGRIPLRRR